MSNFILEPGAIVVGTVSLQAQLPDGKAFTSTVHICSGDTVEVLNARLADISLVIDRQRALGEIPALEAQLLQYEKHLKEATDFLNAKREAQNDGVRLTGQERAAVESMGATVAKIQGEMEDGRLVLLTAKKRAGLL